MLWEFLFYGGILGFVLGNFMLVRDLYREKKKQKRMAMMFFTRKIEDENRE